MNFKEKLLNYFSLNEEEYNQLIVDIKDINVDISNEFFDIDNASKLILDYVKNNKKIMIYGDYDVDGIMATSIMVYTFNKLGVKVGYYIPNRSDGYGINLEFAKKIKEKNYDLLITVDNGVKQFEALTYLKENGLKIVLTDHHDYDKDNLPPHDFFVHPFNKINKEENCGAYVSFMLSIKLLKYVDYYLLSLASEATISDVMPLNNIHNRNIVRVGLKYISKYKNHPFYMLCKNDISEDEMGFVIAPRINAYGRVIEDISINKIVNLFTSESFDEKYLISTKLEQINTKRKELIQEAYKNAYIYNEEGIISVNDSILHGLVGLLAARFQQEFNKPTISFTKVNDLLKGSARSIKGTSIVKFISENNDIIVSGGGHELAGGITIKADDLDEFKNRFNTFIKNNPFTIEEEKYIELEIDEINFENYSILRSFAPFGHNFEEPNFMIRLKKDELILFKGHVKAYLNQWANLIAFNSESKIINDEICFIGKIKIDTYNVSKLSFVVTKII